MFSRAYRYWHGSPKNEAKTAEQQLAEIKQTKALQVEKAKFVIEGAVTATLTSLAYDVAKEKLTMMFGSIMGLETMLAVFDDSPERWDNNASRVLIDIGVSISVLAASLIIGTEVFSAALAFRLLNSLVKAYYEETKRYYHLADAAIAGGIGTGVVTGIIIGYEKKSFLLAAAGTAATATLKALGYGVHSWRNSEEKDGMSYRPLPDSAPREEQRGATPASSAVADIPHDDVKRDEVEIKVESKALDSKNIEAETRLQEINTEIAKLMATLNKQTPASGSFGTLTNAGLFLILSGAAPGLGMFKGAIASVTGSLVNTLAQKAFGNDKGEKMKTFARTLDGIGLSEGVRGVGNLVSNPDAQVGLQTALPAIAQTLFHYNATRDATEASAMKRVRDLGVERAKLMDTLGRSDEIHAQYKSFKME